MSTVESAVQYLREKGWKISKERETHQRSPYIAIHPQGFRMRLLTKHVLRQAEQLGWLPPEEGGDG